MRIAVLGARGNVGRRVVAEALARGHDVTAVVRDAAQLGDIPADAEARVADAASASDVASVSAGQDVVICATRPQRGHEADIERTTRGMLEGVRATPARLLIVGGAATLTVPGSEGKTVLEDARYLPVPARPVAEASARQYEVCRAEARVDWAYLSPSADLSPGERTGNYRVGRDELLLDRHGDSRISMEDLAVAALDEAERPRHHRERFTVAY